MSAREALKRKLAINEETVALMDNVLTQWDNQGGKLAGGRRHLDAALKLTEELNEEHAIVVALSKENQALKAQLEQVCIQVLLHMPHHDIVNLILSLCIPV